MMMRQNWLSYIVLLLLTLALPYCSTDNTPCGNTTCGSGEVCESGFCVLALNISGSDEEELCHLDEDCPKGQVCTLEDSDPAMTCIPRLPCQKEFDCQSGLTCGDDGLCR